MTPTPEQLLKTRFESKHVDALIEHYRTVIGEFQKGQWEKSILRAGKLVEAVLKALWVLIGNTVPRAKDFKVDSVIRELERVPATVAEDTIRLTIPRLSRFIYDIASNRGARHDPDEIDPNVMDASVIAAACAWIVAEMIRYSQKGVVDASGASKLAQVLSQKRFPFFQDVGDRMYFHVKGASARKIGLLGLWRVHPGRISLGELEATIRRHGFSKANAKMGVSRLRNITDDDGQGNLLLLAPGLAEAESLIASTGSVS